MERRTAGGAGTCKDGRASFEVSGRGAGEAEEVGGVQGLMDAAGGFKACRLNRYTGENGTWWWERRVKLGRGAGGG